MQFHQRNKSPETRDLHHRTRPEAQDDAQHNPIARQEGANWKGVLTASLEQNCLAPADEVIVHAFDLYQDELYAPLLAHQHEIAVLYGEITAGVAGLQALVPDLVERAMARHQWEFSQYIDSSGRRQ